MDDDDSGQDFTADAVLATVDENGKMVLDGTDADGGSAITRYWIEWDIQPGFSSGSSSPDKGTYVFTALSTRPYQHFIKDLTHNGPYYVRILAYNAVGPGDYCNKDGFGCDGNELTLSLS